MQAQQGEIIGRQLAQIRLLFHVNRLVKQLSEIKKVNSEAAGQIYHPPTCGQMAANDLRLIACGQLAGALLQRKAARIAKSRLGSPRWYFRVQLLPTLDLTQDVFSLFAGSVGKQQCQCRHTLRAVISDKSFSVFHKKPSKTAVSSLIG